MKVLYMFLYSWSFFPACISVISHLSLWPGPETPFSFALSLCLLASCGVSDSFCGPVSIAQHLPHQAPFPTEPSTVAGLFRGSVLKALSTFSSRLLLVLDPVEKAVVFCSLLRYPVTDIWSLYLHGSVQKPKSPSSALFFMRNNFCNCSCILFHLFLKDTQRHRALRSSQQGDSKWTLSQFLEPKLQAATASILMVRMKCFCLYMQVNVQYLCNRFLFFREVHLLNCSLHMTNQRTVFAWSPEHKTKSNKSDSAEKRSHAENKSNMRSWRDWKTFLGWPTNFAAHYAAFSKTNTVGH